MHRVCLLLSASLVLPITAYPQTTLTGAIQFSTNSSGVASGGLIWHTLANDGNGYYALWLALNPNATSPVNGPSDSQAGIAIELEAGVSYKFYVFGHPGPGVVTGFNGLNLFFDANDSAPGISAFGATNSSDFLPNRGSTFTLQGTSAAGSGKTFYSSGGDIVVLTGYDWNAPATPPGDVCQAFEFSPAPGDVADYFGSFSLRVWPAATLSLSQSIGAPGTKLAVTGGGFASAEKVDIYAGPIGSPRLSTATTDTDGSFTVTVREPPHPYGTMDVYAVGESSGRLGAATIFVTPELVMSPATVAPGGATTAYGFGFGAGETVEIYWNNPRQLLGTATANGEGSSALTITIPTNSSPGINGVIGFGQTTKGLGIGEVSVQ